MANQEHLDILKQGVEVWNQWRELHPELQPDLSETNLMNTNLSGANFRKVSFLDTDLRGSDLSRSNLFSAKFIQANLQRVKLKDANLRRADLSSANLNGVNLNRAVLCQINLSRAELVGTKFVLADLSSANLSGANLREAELPGASLIRANLKDTNLNSAILIGADLTGTNLRGADLSEAKLSRATLVGTDLRGANLTNCSIYGISAWEVKLEGAQQNNLVITHSNEPTITVDNLKFAQFIYLLLNNAEIRDAIDTIAKKAVLILGRFTPERKAVLDALREALRMCGYIPILFDFDKPSSQDLTETVSTLAHLSRFIIVDLTDPSSAPYEVATIASNHIKPIQALFQPSDEGKRVFAMYTDLVKRYHWVLPPYDYQDQEHLLASLQAKVIEPAEQKARELAIH